MTNRHLLPPTLALGLTLFCAACGTPTMPASQAPPAEPATTAAPAAPETATPNPPVDARADSTATLTVPAGDSVAVLLGSLQRPNQKMTVRVPVQSKRRLTARLLVSAAQSNLRFAQVIKPGGQAEGPFGSTVSVATPQNGTYQLVIGHNLMQEGSITQEFKLRVTLTP